MRMNKKNSDGHHQEPQAAGEDGGAERQARVPKGRRALLRAALASAPVILTLGSRSARAAYASLDPEYENQAPG